MESIKFSSEIELSVRALARIGDLAARFPPGYEAYLSFEFEGISLRKTAFVPDNVLALPQIGDKIYWGRNSSNVATGHVKDLIVDAVRAYIAEKPEAVLKGY